MFIYYACRNNIMTKGANWTAIKNEREAALYLEQAFESIDSHAWDLLESLLSKMDESNKRLIVNYLQMNL